MNYKGNINDEINADGEFKRQKCLFSTPFGLQENHWKAEENVYKLYWEKGCQWSNRLVIILDLLGLQDVIKTQAVGSAIESTHYSMIWTITAEDGMPDPDTGCSYLYELYENSKPGFTGRATVPALVDLKNKVVANNDYYCMPYYFEVDFQAFHKEGAPNLFPAEKRTEIEKMNQWLHECINDGIYQMMFARTIFAYEKALLRFEHALNELENLLQNRRFLFGNRLTDSDVRLFMTLAYWETHYYKFLGPLKRGLTGYENLWAYCRDLYSIPAFSHNLDFRFLAKGSSSEEEKGNSLIFNDRFWNQIDYKKKWTEPQNREDLLTQTSRTIWCVEP